MSSLQGLHLPPAYTTIGDSRTNAAHISLAAVPMEPTEESSSGSRSRTQYVEAIDPAKHLWYKENNKDLFRCRIHKDILFRLSPLKRGQSNEAPGSSSSIQRDEVSAGQARPIHTLLQESRPIEAGAFDVKSSTLESFISVARSCAFFAAVRLGHRGLVVPHQLCNRETFSHVSGDEVLTLSRYIRKSSLASNLTYQRCAQSCKDATKAAIRVLEEALKIYDHDPDVLWSLWMHQSISFGWESKTVLETLQTFSNAFQLEVESEWDTDELRERQEAAKYHYNLRKECQISDCTCAQVTLGKRNFWQRLKDLVSPTICAGCKERRAKPPVLWQHRESSGMNEPQGLNKDIGHDSTRTSNI
ncbi:hypothetical protein ABW19_dt0202648 [Dactylella cylindrospora]|nr:hypothetical protein ABW19_dt0202648 [Dactylella cylindrospora]